MSDQPSPNSPLSGILSTLVMFGAPIALILMLGVVGFVFIANTGDGKRDQKAEESPSPAAAETGEEAKKEVAGGDAASGKTPAPAPAPVAADSSRSAIDPAVMDLGKSTYITCAACHGTDGKGLPVGAMLMAPSLVGSELLLGDPDAPILAVLKGIEKENMNFMGAMAPLGTGLNDEQIAAVLTYMRNFGGNQASAVTVEQVAAARTKFADVNAPAGVKRADIPGVVAAHK